MDIETLPPVVQSALAYLKTGLDLAQGWLFSPAAWSQFAILLIAYFLAVLLNRRFAPKLSSLIAPSGSQDTLIAQARLFLLMFASFVSSIVSSASLASPDSSSNLL